MLRYAVRLGVSGPALRPFLARLEALEAGRPVVVQHGYEIDLLPPFSGPFVLEPDGTLSPCEPVYADPSAPVRTVTGYRRPDGSPVDT